ncbi:MAG TPA: SGNH/GDSL hydrolase family protein [Magnetospirillaceae bacterium]|jgi:lysophospholipase L1-like esterase
MKRILCYGDSNTWGTAPMTSMDDVRRWGPDERWTGVMHKALGTDWTLVEEGLPARTTVHDDPIDGIHKNGKTYLQPCLESHWPLDVIVVMLGTNDLKPRFSVAPHEIALGVGSLLATIKMITPPWTKPPKLLAICPPHATASGWLAETFAGADERTKKMAPLYKIQSERWGAAFFDAATVAKTSPVDGVHFDVANHKALGLAVAAEVKKLAG